MRSAWLVGLPDVAHELVATIAADEARGFPAHVVAREVIRATLPTMDRMLDSLP
jgi:hypothetical protein